MAWLKHQGVSDLRARAITNFSTAVIRTPGTYDDSVRTAAQTSKALGWHVVADTSGNPADPMPACIMHGYMTLVIEILQQLRRSGEALPTHVFLQGGVGGLAAAVAAFLWEDLGPKKAPTFIVVEPARADCLSLERYLGKYGSRPTVRAANRRPVPGTTAHSSAAPQSVPAMIAAQR